MRGFIAADKLTDVGVTLDDQPESNQTPISIVSLLQPGSLPDPAWFFSCEVTLRRPRSLQPWTSWHKRETEQHVAVLASGGVRHQSPPFTRALSSPISRAIVT